jgi:hypothetical protein
MKSFKQFVTEGKYDQLKKELLDTEGVGDYIFYLKQLKNKYKFDSAYTALNNRLVVKFSPVKKADVSLTNENIYLDIYNWEKNLKGYNTNGDVGYGFNNVEFGAKVIDVVVPDDNDLFKKNVEIKIDNTKTDRFQKYPSESTAILTMTFPFFRAKLVYYG